MNFKKATRHVLPHAPANSGGEKEPLLIPREVAGQHAPSDAKSAINAHKAMAGATVPQRLESFT